MTSWIESTMTQMGYWGVVLLMFLENVFPPIPSELVMPLAGYTASQDQMTLWGVIVAGTAGSVLGAVPLYYLGKVVGGDRLERWADRHGHWLMVKKSEIERAERWFSKRGKATVFFCRMVPGLRSLISIPAGVCGMPLAPFLLWTAAGAAIWTALLAWAGSALGNRYDQVSKYVGSVSYVALGGLLLWYVVHVWRRKRSAA